MSVRLEVHREVAAPLAAAWPVLIDWAGQSRWIPFTTVRVTSPQSTGLGVRAEALSGFWLGRLPVGLLDRFVVTGWRPPSDVVSGPNGAAARRAELEVLHLGPYFSGEGVFTLTERAGSTEVRCVEMITVPGGRLAEPFVRLALPVLRSGFQGSLAAFARVVERPPVSA